MDDNQQTLLEAFLGTCRLLSDLFHTVMVTLVSLVVFSSTVSIFPFAPSFYLFD
jgi:hypothetical protein